MIKIMINTDIANGKNATKQEIQECLEQFQLMMDKQIEEEK